MGATLGLHHSLSNCVDLRTSKRDISTAYERASEPSCKLSAKSSVLSEVVLPAPADSEDSSGAGRLMFFASKSKVSSYLTALRVEGANGLAGGVTEAKS